MSEKQEPVRIEGTLLRANEPDAQSNSYTPEVLAALAAALTEQGVAARVVAGSLEYSGPVPTEDGRYRHTFTAPVLIEEGEAMSGTAALAARLEKEARREEWQRRLITWGSYYRAELMALPSIAPAAPPPDWYAPLRAVILDMPEEHRRMLIRVYVDAEVRLPHRRALAALLAMVDKA